MNGYWLMVLPPPSLLTTSLFSFSYTVVNIQRYIPSSPFGYFYAGNPPFPQHFAVVLVSFGTHFIIHRENGERGVWRGKVIQIKRYASRICELYIYLYTYVYAKSRGKVARKQEKNDMERERERE